MTVQNQNFAETYTNPPGRYWLTMFQVGKNVLAAYSDLDNQERVAGVIQSGCTDPTTETRMFTDEEGERIFVALNLYSADEKLAVSEGLALMYTGLETAKFMGMVIVEQARVVPAERLGSTSVEDAWPAMDYVEPEDLTAAITALVEEKTKFGTFIETQ